MKKGVIMYKYLVVFFLLSGVAFAQPPKDGVAVPAGEGLAFFCNDVNDTYEVMAKDMTEGRRAGLEVFTNKAKEGKCGTSEDSFMVVKTVSTVDVGVVMFYVVEVTIDDKNVFALLMEPKAPRRVVSGGQEDI